MNVGGDSSVDCNGQDVTQGGVLNVFVDICIEMLSAPQNSTGSPDHDCTSRVCRPFPRVQNKMSETRKFADSLQTVDVSWKLEVDSNLCQEVQGVFWNVLTCSVELGAKPARL